MSNCKSEIIDGIDYRTDADDCDVTEKHGNSYGYLWCHNKRELKLTVSDNFLGKRRHADLHMTLEQAKAMRKQLTSFIRYADKF